MMTFGSYTNISVSTAAVTNRFVVSTNMSLTPYTIANASPAWNGGCNVTITHTTVAGADTLGTITIWVAVSTADTIVIGCAAGAILASTGGVLGSVIVNTTAAGTVILADKRGTIATLKTSIAEGVYPFNINFAGFLKVTTSTTNDVTITHTATIG